MAVEKIWKWAAAGGPRYVRFDHNDSDKAYYLLLNHAKDQGTTAARPLPMSGWGSQVMQAVKQGGFTFHDHVGDGPTSGYMVSVAKANEQKIPVRDLRPEHIGEYRDLHQAELKDPNTYMGGWVHRGSVYLDVSTHVQDRNEAMALARKHRQLAVFDIGKGESIDTEPEAQPVQPAPMQQAASYHLIGDDDTEAVNVFREAVGLPRLEPQ